jgi:integrase
MRKALNEKTLAALKPLSKRVEYRDLLLPGFGVRVSTTGQKTLFLSYRYGTKQRRMKLGIYPRITLQEARTKALQALRLVDEGIDPTRTRRVRSHLVCNVFDEYIEKYAKVKTRGWKGARAMILREFVGPYGQRDIRKIERVDIISILDDIVARGANAQANRFLAYARRMLNWSVERGFIEGSPANGIKAPCREQPRDRVLSDDEIGRMIPVCRQHSYPFGDLFQVMLLTAQRRGEVSGMRWSELDLVNRIWHMPSERTKNGRAHSVPLSEQVMQIVTNVPRFADSDFVFTTTGRSPVSGWGKPNKRLCDDAGVHDWHLHDMRRTAASGMARLGVQPYVVEKILNHISGTISGVAATYNRYGYDPERRDALEKWGNHVASLETANA